MRNINNYLVSVIIPVYNGSNYLQDAINSVLNQTYRNIEIIVVDDGSSDRGKTKKIAKNFGSKIKYFKKKNGGVSTALNFGIKKSKGKFICWLSHDDVFLPNKISENIKYANENIILFSDFFLSDSSLSSLKKITIDNITFDDFRLWIIMNKSLNGCTTFIPKKILVKEKFNPKLRVCQDYDLWFRLSNTYNFKHLNFPTIISRRHSLQHSTRHTLTDKYEIQHFYSKIITQYFKSFKWKVKSRISLFYLFIRMINKMAIFGYSLPIVSIIKLYLPRKSSNNKKNFLFCIMFYLIYAIFYLELTLISILRVIKYRLSLILIPILVLHRA